LLIQDFTEAEITLMLEYEIQNVEDLGTPKCGLSIWKKTIAAARHNLPKVFRHRRVQAGFTEDTSSPCAYVASSLMRLEDMQKPSTVAS